MQIVSSLLIFIFLFLSFLFSAYLTLLCVSLLWVCCSIFLHRIKDIFLCLCLCLFLLLSFYISFFSSYFLIAFSLSLLLFSLYLSLNLLFVCSSSCLHSSPHWRCIKHDADRSLRCHSPWSCPGPHTQPSCQSQSQSQSQLLLMSWSLLDAGLSLSLSLVAAFGAIIKQLIKLLGRSAAHKTFN